MSELFDDLTRIAGSGLSRRETIRLALLAVAGAYLGFPQAAHARDRCLPQNLCREANPNDTFCGFGNLCCPGERGTDGIVRPRQCCGSRRVDRPCVCCPPGESCCESNRAGQGDVFDCCRAGEQCCDKSGQCCPPAQCCGAVLGQKVCCDACQICGPNQTCVDAGLCANDPQGKTKCCPKLDRTGHYCCPPDICCGEEKDVCGQKSPRRNRSRIATVTTTSMSVVIQDDQGVSSITVVKAQNATVSIPDFTPGTADEITVTATKVDETKKASVELKYCTTGCSCGTCCWLIDPVLTTLQIPPGKNRERQSFAGLPAAERYLTIRNGTPGLRGLRVNVNGQAAGGARLRDGEVKVLDLAPFLMEEGNIVTLVGEGAPASRALILIADTPGTRLKNPVWEPGASRPEVDGRWVRL